MNCNSIQLAIFLISFYGILDAHVVDIHLPNSGEIKMMDDAEREKENDRNQEILNDPDASDEDRIKAAGSLQDNGRMA